ncbi:MAG TPA: hypothetical protein VM324_09215, partial [Egibacteraceae bacterium]|nr:hypothetical protein [Egibacteraceae bacterium]
MHGDDARIEAIIQALYDHGVELAVTAHDHNYQRFPALDPSGTGDAKGVRQFIVGTGGAYLYDFNTVDPRAEARSRSFGVLKLLLRPNAYDWEFLTDPGGINPSFTDSGTGSCHTPATSPSPSPSPSP